ncbi:MAG: A24 family peptidase [Pirellula sp.]|jgi:prepilin signal peptidase PulO-like enzyme (type II secretory pathway)|nr:A24 family peptidase [Pirellula sp.]
MNWWIAIIGLLLGPMINLAIYSLAYFPRPISPWQKKKSLNNVVPANIESIQPSVLAFVPVLGWLTRWRERAEFGNWFWLRPLLIELTIPFGLMWIYAFVMSGGLLPELLPDSPVAVPLESFIFVASLLGLLVVATFIDFDERTIPDAITIPGTLFALLGSSLFPGWRLQEFEPNGTNLLRGVHPNSPYESFSPEWLQSSSLGLILALFFWVAWCFALMDRVWITRRGWQKAIVYFAEILRRSPTTFPKLGMIAIGAIVITIAHSLLSQEGWEGLFTSLFGMAMGGVLVWSFRIVASAVMGREALGFGDVTLMAMVGAFTGWQAVWISFFLAPLFGLVFVITIYLVTKDGSTPFGPYLSLSVAVTTLTWREMWPYASPLFFSPGAMLVLLMILLLTLAVSLMAVVFVKLRLGNESQ